MTSFLCDMCAYYFNKFMVLHIFVAVAVVVVEVFVVFVLVARIA